MNKPLTGEKLAVLVSNGFNEQDFVVLQRALQPLGVTICIVGMSNGLVNSWNSSGWGLNFATDQVLNEALSADFSMLLVPGGRGSVDKLKTTAHTRRFINGFIDTMKPVIALGEALELLALTEQLSSKQVAGLAEKQEEAENAGASWVDAAYTVDGNLMTGISLAGADESYITAVKDFLLSDVSMDEAA